MIKILRAFFFCFISVHAMGQYVPNSSQAFQYSTVYNPAFTGVDAYTDIRLGYRYQWAGIEGAPKSLNFTINTRLRQPSDLTYNTPRSSSVKLIRVPKRKSTIHALGANVFKSSYGQVELTGGSLNYAIHFLLTPTVRLALGVEALVDNTKLSYDGIQVRDPDGYYTQLLARGSSSTQLNIRTGALLYGKNFYAGVSYLPTWQTDIQTTELAVNKPFYQASAQAGVSFPLGNVLQMKPSVIGLLQIDHTFTADYTVKTYFQDIAYFGLTYRSVKSGVVLLGFNINEILGVSYSYEMSLGKFKQYNSGSHEIVLGVKLHNFKRQGSYTW